MPADHPFIFEPNTLSGMPLRTRVKANGSVVLEPRSTPDPRIVLAILIITLVFVCMCLATLILVASRPAWATPILILAMVFGLTVGGGLIAGFYVQTRRHSKRPPWMVWSPFERSLTLPRQSHKLVGEVSIRMLQGSSRFEGPGTVKRSRVLAQVQVFDPDTKAWFAVITRTSSGSRTLASTREFAERSALSLSVDRVPRSQGPSESEFASLPYDP
ncbi:MAG: hypothetical protein RIB60_01340 [Phycisphaerales bacterium]